MQNNTTTDGWILALETSSARGSVALIRSGQLIEHLDLGEGTRHGQALLPGAQAMLARHRLAPQDLGCVACGIGPGSYTGVRIGTMSAKALAFGLGKPIIGISSLQALAHGVRQRGGEVVTIMDSRRDEVLVAVWQVTPDAAPQALVAEHATHPEDASRLATAGRLVVGDTAQRDPEVFRRMAPQAEIVPHAWPGAAEVGLLAALRLEKNDTDDPLLLQPVLLRQESRPAPYEKSSG